MTALRPPRSQFPPAAVLCVLMMQSASSGNPLSFVMFPWLAGHVGLYASALGMSAVRSQVQLSIGSARVRDLGGLPDDQIRAIFSRFDTSKDGLLSKEEELLIRQRLMQVMGFAVDHELHQRLEEAVAA